MWRVAHRATLERKRGAVVTERYGVAGADLILCIALSSDELLFRARSLLRALILLSGLDYGQTFRTLLRRMRLKLQTTFTGTRIVLAPFVSNQATFSLTSVICSWYAPGSFGAITRTLLTVNCSPGATSCESAVRAPL